MARAPTLGLDRVIEVAFDVLPLAVFTAACIAILITQTTTPSAVGVRGACRAHHGVASVVVRTVAWVAQPVLVVCRDGYVSGPR